jgi:fructokinase
MEYFGGIEAGGTKFVCVIATGPDNILAEERIATVSPDETISKVVKFFINTSIELKINLSSLGIGSFGPINLDRTSPGYGFITTTPKPGWQNIDIVGPIKDELQIPIAFDTDVNAAAIGEGKWGAGDGLENYLYFTIGTGIGGGAIINGLPLHGLIHPEMGHILLNQNQLIDHYVGKCPYHQNCFEGLASGPAINDRWGQPAYQLPLDHQAWLLEADYIAQAMSTFICTFSPQKIILGGGVMLQQHLFPMIRLKTLEYLNGYVHAPQILDNIDNYIVPPLLGNRAGVLGAIAMAEEIIKPAEI